MASQEKLYVGKTKDIYRLPNGNLWIVFKDDVTGENGVVDPGANTVMGQIEGKGRMSLRLTEYFFDLVSDQGVPTHLVQVDVARGAMEVKPADVLGRGVKTPGGLEFICRTLAYGSFLRRYGNIIQEPQQALDYLVEITLKDDERGDPLINDDALVALAVLSRPQLDRAKALTRQITRLIAQDLQDKNLALVDMKMEFGLIDGEITLIDEISADAMRVMDSEGKQLSHMALYQTLCD